MASSSTNGVITTRVVPVEGVDLGHFKYEKRRRSLDFWQLPETTSAGLQILQDAAQLLRTSNTPVAFPTETVYGLGADATRSSAVKGIYAAKGRPSDNPLIIHICDLSMLRSILFPGQSRATGEILSDPIPAIYKPLVERFWPGPLTILLPNPRISILAPEVTAGLPNFGVRMPDSALALSLINLAGIPIAAPSANASTKPSTTTASHVLHDLSGRIEVILDGGPCTVGVESTIVDGLSNPPVVLRPGGISICAIRACPGWEGVKKAYKDNFEMENGEAPRAPGMKYKHYSPRAKVLLAESSADIIPKDELGLRLELSSTAEEDLVAYNGLPYELSNGNSDGSFRLPIIGIVRTRHWKMWGGWNENGWTHVVPLPSPTQNLGTTQNVILSPQVSEGELHSNAEQPLLLAKIIEISLGKSTQAIAHGLFSALRDLDLRGAEVVYVEGIEDDGVDLFANGDAENRIGEGKVGDEGDIAAAVMNRLRKAASVIRG